MKSYSIMWRRTIEKPRVIKVKATNCFQAKAIAVKDYGVNPRLVVRVVEMGK